MNTPVDITEKLSGRELPSNTAPAARKAHTVERKLRTDIFGGLVLTLLLAGLLGQLVFLLAMG